MNLNIHCIKAGVSLL